MWVWLLVAGFFESGAVDCALPGRESPLSGSLGRLSFAICFSADRDDRFGAAWRGCPRGAPLFLPRVLGSPSCRVPPLVVGGAVCAVGVRGVPWRVGMLGVLRCAGGDWPIFRVLSLSRLRFQAPPRRFRRVVPWFRGSAMFSRWRVPLLSVWVASPSGSRALASAGFVVWAWFCCCGYWPVRL